jgi:hypothetical protein
MSVGQMVFEQKTWSLLFTVKGVIKKRKIAGSKSYQSVIIKNGRYQKAKKIKTHLLVSPIPNPNASPHCQWLTLPRSLYRSRAYTALAENGTEEVLRVIMGHAIGVYILALVFKIYNDFSLSFSPNAKQPLLIQSRTNCASVAGHELMHL